MLKNGSFAIAVLLIGFGFATGVGAFAAVVALDVGFSATFLTVGDEISSDFELDFVVSFFAVDADALAAAEVAGLADFVGAFAFTGALAFADALAFAEVPAVVFDLAGTVTSFFATVSFLEIVLFELVFLAVSTEALDALLLLAVGAFFVGAAFVDTFLAVDLGAGLAVDLGATLAVDLETALAVDFAVALGSLPFVAFLAGAALEAAGFVAADLGATDFFAAVAFGIQAPPHRGQNGASP